MVKKAAAMGVDGIAVGVFPYFPGYDCGIFRLCFCFCRWQAAKASASVKELENEIGVELFKRTNRGITVTPEGEEFLGYARQVVEQYRLIESKYIEKENVRKKFSVSMQHYSFAVQAFVEMVRQFGMDKYEFAVHETKTYEVIEDVKNFKSEIGILYLTIKYAVKMTGREA